MKEVGNTEFKLTCKSIYVKSSVNIYVKSSVKMYVKSLKTVARINFHAVTYSNSFKYGNVLKI